MKRISITVYDDRYKKVFEVNKAKLETGIFQLGGYVQKLGVPLKVVNATGNSKQCWVCGKAIKKGTGLRYEGKAIHQACLMEARQKV